MTWINFIASKYARGTEGHITSEEIVRVASQLEDERYHCVFDLVKEELKVELDTGRTQVVDGKVKKIYSYHKQGSGVEGPLTFNQYEGPASPAFGLVQFDFDHAEDINISYKDALGFIEFLGIEQYHLSFSGSKGFHVAVPFDAFGLEVSPELPKILHDLAAYLVTFFPTMDVKVYNANRKFRILNTKHSKTGLYKTLIHRDMNLDEIREYCKTRKNDWYLNLNVSEAASSLVKAIEESKKNHAYNKEKAGSHGDQTRFESYDGKICIKRLIEDKCEEGGRNNTALVIAYDMFKTGKTKNHAIEVITKWCHSNEFQLSESLPIVDRAFSESQYYNHGCQDSIKAAKCSAKCPLWKKLDPEKRPIPVDAPKAAFKEAERKYKTPASEFIDDYLYENIIKIDLQGNFSINGKYIDQASLENQIFKDALDLKRSVDGCPKQTINAILDVWMRKEKERLLQDLRDHLRFTEENDELKNWLTAVKPDADETDLTVMKHWIWLVKRKLNGLEVKNHIMPIFSGITGTGKSKAVERLILPLRIVTLTPTLAILNDERQDYNLIQNYIMFFDEMAKASSVDIDTLKNKITLGWISYRKLGTNASVRGPNNCSFICATNNDTVDMLKDPTSARRYYELKVLKRCDWDKVNAIDPLLVWRSIDESQEEGFYGAASDMIKERQELIRDRDSVEEWLEYDNLKPKEGESFKDVKARDLYDAYVSFMAFQKRDRYLVSINKFGRLMRTHVGGKSEKNTGNFYRVSSSFTGKSLDQAQQKAPSIVQSDINF